MGTRDWQEVADGVAAAARGDAKAEARALQRIALRMVVERDIFCRCGKVLDLRRAVLHSSNEARCSSDCGRKTATLTFKGHTIVVGQQPYGRATYTCGKAVLWLVTTDKQARKQGYSVWTLKSPGQKPVTFHTALPGLPVPAGVAVVSKEKMQQALLDAADKAAGGGQ